MTVTSTPGWPIVERFDLIEQVRAAPAGCVIVGPAGAGKSTLAAAASDRAIVVTGVLGLQAIPLGALSMAEMTASLAPPGPAAPGAPDAPAGTDAEDDGELVTHVRRWLASCRAAGAPIVVDDPAALDPDSVAVLADELGRGLVLVVTHRPDQPPPDALAAAIEAAGLPAIEAPPLDPSMVGLVLEHALGREVDGRAVEQLAALSVGNPLLLRELVRDLSTRDAWIDDGRSVGLRDDAIAPHGRVADLVRARVPDDPDELEVLQLVAHAGTLPVDLGRAVAGASALDALAGDGWLTVGETIAVPHPVMAQVVLETLDAAAARRLLQRALDRLGDPAGLGADSRLRALRWALAVDGELSADELRWARAEAGRRFDRDLTCLIADRLALVEPSIDSVLELALSLAQADRYDEAIAVLVDASGSIVSARDVDDVARFLLRFAGPLARMKRWGDPPPDLDRLTAEWADGALGTTAYTTTLGAMEALAVGDLPRARELADAGRLAAEQAAIDGLPGDADEVAMLAGLYSGDHAGALEAFDRLDGRLADTAYRHPKAIVIDAAASSLLMLAGRFEHAYDFDRRVRSAARSTHDHDRAREMSGHLGMTSLFLGRVDDAVEAFDRFLDQPAPPSSLRTIYLAGLAQAHALAGRLADAERVLAQAEREADVVSAMMQPDFDNLVGMVLHLLGEVEAGEARTRQGMVVAGEWMNTRSQLMGCLSLARSGRIEDDDVPFALEVVPRASAAAPTFARGVGELLVAAHGRDLDALEGAAATFAATGFGLGVAEALAAACRLDAGRDPRARANRLAALDGALARCPGLAGGTVLVERGVDALTERERQLAVLAAGGLANPVIAQRSGISVRTVENSLHRAFAKLGVGARAEIAAAMSPPALPDS